MNIFTKPIEVTKFEVDLMTVFAWRMKSFILIS